MLEKFIAGQSGVEWIGGLLFAVGMMLLMNEAVSPGLGASGVIGVALHMGCFLPGVLSGATPWAVLLLAAVGGALMLMDSFITGFGPLAAIGLVLLLLSLWIAADGLAQFFFTLCGCAVLTALSLPVTLHRLPRTRMMQKIRLDDTLTPEQPAQALPAPGQMGVAVTDLKPQGIVRIGEERCPARAAAFIEKGAPVRVTGSAAGAVTVERIN